MNKNQKPSMSKRRATVAAVLCFVAAIAIAGTYTFNDYRKTQKNELAKAEEKAKQDSEAAKETGTSKIKNEDMTSDTPTVRVTDEKIVTPRRVQKGG